MQGRTWALWKTYVLVLCGAAQQLHQLFGKPFPQFVLAAFLRISWFYLKHSNKRKKRRREDFLEYVPAVWIMMGEQESPLSSMAHGHLAGDGFFIYNLFGFFFFGQRKYSPRTSYRKKSLAEFPVLTQLGFSALQLMCMTQTLNTSRATWESFDSELNLTIFLV